MMNLTRFNRTVLLFSILGAVACSGDDAGVPDAGGSDAAVLDAAVLDAAALDAASIDAAASDADATADAGVPVDARVSDAGGGTDGGAAVDGGDIPPGECNTASDQCRAACVRANECVTVCGGPVTNCGCCPCAAGSRDITSCPR